MLGPKREGEGIALGGVKPVGRVKGILTSPDAVSSLVWGTGEEGSGK